MTRQIKSEDFFQDFEKPYMPISFWLKIKHEIDKHRRFELAKKIICFVYTFPVLVLIDAVFYPASVWHRYSIAYDKSIIKELEERLKNEEKTDR